MTVACQNLTVMPMNYTEDPSTVTNHCWGSVAAVFDCCAIMCEIRLLASFVSNMIQPKYLTLCCYRRSCS